jgi:hypothetical protein
MEHWIFKGSEKQLGTLRHRLWQENKDDEIKT